MYSILCISMIIWFLLFFHLFGLVWFLSLFFIYHFNKTFLCFICVSADISVMILICSFIAFYAFSNFSILIISGEVVGNHVFNQKMISFKGLLLLFMLMTSIILKDLMFSSVRINSSRLIFCLFWFIHFILVSILISNPIYNNQWYLVNMLTIYVSNIWYYS